MDGKPFQSITGASQMEEPKSTVEDQRQSSSTTHSPSASASISTPTLTSTANNLSKRPSLSSIPASAAKKVQSSQASSINGSPKPSRESSPVRVISKGATSTSRPGAGRPRKNSSKDVSPARSASGQSTIASPAGATTTPLLSSNIPTLSHSHSEPIIKAPVPQKSSAAAESRDSLRWPISPRLRSPPPITRPVPAPRRPDTELPSINVQRSTPTASAEQQSSISIDTRVGEGFDTPPTKTPTRGVSGAGSTLETVQETSQPSTPAIETQASRQKLEEGLQKLAEQDNLIEKSSTKNMDSKTKTESGSDSGGTKGEIKLRSTSTTPAPNPRTAAPPPKSYSTGGAAGRGKPSGEGSTKNMTVETETVSSIPQVAVSGNGGPGLNGSLRAKPSSETIRPRKEKKKTARKAPSVTSGMASSKADIFEAKIASAVDEANSSDSEETFVYESNPPEPSQQIRRYHSRTPSATSMASQLDQRGSSRVNHGAEAQPTVTLKKSMKFANSYSNNVQDAANGEDDGKGTGRSHLGTGRGTTHHHHIGRWGRNGGGNGHQSLFDNESPFPNVARSKLGTNSRHSSRPTSPRVTKLMNGKRSPVSASYDIDDGAGADDERTPLVGGGNRSLRSAGRRRPGSSSLRHLERQFEDQSFASRFSGCLLLLLMLILVIGGAFSFMYATTQPLTDVKVSALKNVLVSQQELMLDMEVWALNPNVVVVNVDSMNVEVFARSKHADDWDWFNLQPPSVLRRIKRSVLTRATLAARSSEDGPVDDDPDYEDPDDTSTLKLGQLLEFDSPLSFEGSPFSSSHSRAIGGVRLKQPGNTTDSGGETGMDKWSKILKYDFDLRVKGVLEYQLPLSARVRKASVDFTTRVKPSKSTGPEDGSTKKKLRRVATIV